MSTALAQAALCDCRSPYWLRIGQRHQGSPFAEASTSLTMPSIQKLHVHKLHFPYLSLCLQNWSFCHVAFMFGPPTATEKFNGVSPCLFTANHIMLPTPVFSIHSHTSPSPWEIMHWILSFLLYCSTAALVSLCFKRASAFRLHCIISGLCLHLSLVCILTLKLVFIELSCPPSDCSSMYAFLYIDKLLWFAFINYKIRREIQKFGFGTTRQACSHSHSSWCVRSILSKAGSLAVRRAKSINIRGNYRLSAREKNVNCRLLLITKAG